MNKENIEKNTCMHMRYLHSWIVSACLHCYIFLAGKDLSTGKRKKRCGSCEGCTAKDCQMCVYCKDMIKYGGLGKRRKSCVQRRCVKIFSELAYNHLNRAETNNAFSCSNSH